MKRLFTLVLCLMMALTLIPAAAAEDAGIARADPMAVASEAPARPEAKPTPAEKNDTPTASYIIDGIKWEYYGSSNRMVISQYTEHGLHETTITTKTLNQGEEWKDFLYNYLPLTKHLVIEEGITIIDDYCFDHEYHDEFVPSFTTVTLPSTLVRINKSAFCGQGFASIDLKNVAYLGYQAFKNTKFTSITLPSTVATIDYQCFVGSDVNMITFLGDAPNIHSSAFMAVEATVYTPSGNSTWTAENMQDYGGTLTWVNRPPSSKITSASVTITPPAVGATPDYNPVIPSGANYYSDAYNTTNYKNDVRWNSNGAYLPVDSAIFEAGNEYAVYIYLTPKDGYAFASSCTGTINGNIADVHVESSGQLLLSYTFPALASKPTITTQPKSVSQNVGTTAKYTVAATGTGLTYQWQYNGGTGWKNCTMTGYNTATLSVPVTAARNGYKYRCVVSNASGSVTSSAAKLTVKTKITAQPQSVSQNVGTTAKFTVAATGAGLTYQWQYRTSSTAAWKNSTLTGCKTATMSVPVTAARNKYQYRCVITDANGAVVNSNAATLTVKTKITAQPTNQSGYVGGTAKFTVTATGAGLKYKWQFSADGKTWKDSTLTGYNTATMSVPITAARNGYQYRCKVSSVNGAVLTSSAAKLTVKTKITAQPKSVTQAVGTTAKFTVTATGAGLKYQWQFSADGTTWKNSTLAGYNTAAMSVPVTAARNGYQYRCVITNANGAKTTSSAAKLTVK